MLYGLFDQYKSLYDMLQGDEIDEQTFVDTLESMNFDGQVESHIENLAKLIKMNEYESAAYDAEIARFKKKKTASVNCDTHMRNHISCVMKLVGRNKIKTSLFDLAIRANPEKVVIDDVSAVLDNAKYLKSRKPNESEINKTALKEDLKSGIDVPGAHLEKGESLQIK